MPETALIVEDEPRVAQLCQKLLAKRGFASVIVSSAAAAAEAVRSGGNAFGLAYVDVGLPDGSGLDVAAEIRRLEPGLPVIVATGSLDEIDAGPAVVLRKPFTLVQFAEAVERALGSAGSRSTPSP